MKLVRLIYASRLVAPLTKSGVQNILNVAERTNRNVGVTGYLCISPLYALQCLEGEREAVNALYNKIASDVRHQSATILRYAEPWRRLFPEWHMGYSNELSSAAPESSRWRDASGFNPYLVESDLIENVIEELCERTERMELRA
ncbi:MAG: BLUF domain-containing protein [Casimicrobium sp.]